MGLSKRGLSGRRSRIKVMTTYKLTTEDVQVIKNQCLIYLLPMLGKSISEFLNLKGIFIKAKEFPELEEHIFLLLNKSDIMSFSMTSERLKNKSNFFYEYSPDNNHVMLVYTVPVYYLLDYDKFKLGKYSEFTELYKQHILKFFECPRGHYIERVLYKEEAYRKDLEKMLSFTDDGFPVSQVSLKDQELASKPGIEDIYSNDIINEER